MKAGDPVRLVFSTHALRRMFERGISVAVLTRMLEGGTEIEERPDDEPYPSRLLLGFVGDLPVHVVLSGPTEAGETVVVTVYVPETTLWDKGFRRRRRRRR